MTSEAHHITGAEFETLYLRLRQQEGRVYSDYELMQLPHISPAHPHYNEWQVRSRSAKKLTAYLEQKKLSLDMLEIGCGNGWLCHSLAGIPGTTVIGTDVNFTELQQAARVFQDIPNLHFVYGDINNGLFREKKFDIIVFAASIQYFETLEMILGNALKLLKPGGEVHIIDSSFYSIPEIKAAQQRSRLYYEKAGFPAMTSCYFHHSLEELKQYHFSILHNPKTLLNRFSKEKNPFYWIRIRN